MSGGASRRPAALLPALLAVALAACSRHEAHAPSAAAPAAPVAPVAPAPAAGVPPAATMSVPAPDPGLDKQAAGAWMHVLFGERYQSERGFALAEMSDGEGGTALYGISPAAATRLADGRTVLVANAFPADQDGNDQSAHATSGLLNVYFLKQQGGEWKVLGRHERVDELGSHGSIGSVAWAMLGPGKPGFVMSSGGTWQGTTISQASVYDLSDGVRSLGSFSEHVDNGGDCLPEARECRDIDGALRFVAADSARAGPYWDIQVDYTGRRYTLTETPDGKEVEQLKASIKETTRYRFDGKAYQLVAGKDPIPDA